ncbi:hypothetical protein K461DRAFT_320490 [Myriangium duriaei CBS 260.36]|uniref:DUF4219 domain-containing protein n=1 Tax=Myriangium duriaei CBS 260.36 TaxID=1168546 RepID=A0A9P4MH45_9PEZI|nr:hypothetical protein K461DRAFT_320490 [Myriangium duriaei CBS 260.36]
MPSNTIPLLHGSENYQEWAQKVARHLRELQIVDCIQENKPTSRPFEVENGLVHFGGYRAGLATQIIWDNCGREVQQKIDLRYPYITAYMMWNQLAEMYESNKIPLSYRLH